MEIAAAKLQHDLYEKRYRVFQAIRKALSNAAVQGNVMQDQLRSFVLDTGDAVFLFNDGLARYVDEMRSHFAKLASIEIALKDMPVGDERTRAVRESRNHSDWLDDQIEGLAARFMPFLRLDRRTLRQRLAGLGPEHP